MSHDQFHQNIHNFTIIWYNIYTLPLEQIVCAWLRFCEIRYHIYYHEYLVINILLHHWFILVYCKLLVFPYPPGEPKGAATAHWCRGWDGSLEVAWRFVEDSQVWGVFLVGPRGHENFEAEIHVANVDVPDERFPLHDGRRPQRWYRSDGVFSFSNEIMFLEKRFRISKTLRSTYPPTKPRGTFLLSLWSSKLLVFHGALDGDVLRCSHYVTSTGFL